MDQPNVILEMKRINKARSALLSKIGYCEMMAAATPGMNFDSEMVDKPRNLDAPFVKWVYKKIELEEKLKNIDEEFCKACTLLDAYLNLLDGVKEMMVVSLRYELGKSWAEVADELHFSESTLYRTHRSAMLKLIEIEKSIEQGKVDSR